jgi:RNA polymerase sigma-70 factor (ECF subfamily)
MNSTSESLLIRLRSTDDSEAWRQFVRLYTPLVFFWARKTGLSGHDAADLVQEVLLVLVRKLPGFRYDANRSFRSWLRTVTLNQWRQWHRRKKEPAIGWPPGSINELAEPEASQEFWEKDYQETLVAQAIEANRDRFAPATWAALKEYLGGDLAAAAVANRHGITVSTLYSAKSRLMRYLRTQLENLLD